MHRMPGRSRRPGSSPRRGQLTGALGSRSRDAPRAGAVRAETPRIPRGNTAAPPGRKHRGARGGNARRPERKRRGYPGRNHGTSRRNAPRRRAQMRHIIARWTVTLQVSGSPGGTCNKPAARRTRARRQADGAPQTDPVSPGRRKPSVGWGGRAAQHPGRPGRPPRPFPDHKFRDRKYLLAALERRLSIHLHASYLNVISGCR
jgi:hypothetical protein